ERRAEAHRARRELENPRYRLRVRPGREEPDTYGQRFRTRRKGAAEAAPFSDKPDVVALSRAATTRKRCRPPGPSAAVAPGTPGRPRSGRSRAGWPGRG